jgi:protein gp37
MGSLEEMEKYPRPFLSIEPLLGCLQCHIPDKFERIIVGAMTGPGAAKPQKEWIESVMLYAPSEKLYWKPNLRVHI